jgi:biopolymer transport protein TolQ
MHIFFSAYSQSDFFGKLIFIGLMLLSLICWVILIYKVWLTRKVKKLSLAFQTALEKNKERLFAISSDELPQTKSSEVPHPFRAIFEDLKQKTLEILEKNHFFASQSSEKPPRVYLSQADLELVEAHAMTTISREAKYLDKNLFVLSTIVTLAPFLGLLGTVWGILLTFSALQQGASASSNALVLGGLATALATTVLGLVIAIPALISYNYLKSSLKNHSSDMEDFLSLLLSQIELQYRKADIG